MANPIAPTMRTLAKEAGVTSMTVSLALRNSPKISSATRKRIQRLAKKRGYRPDPQVARLMHHLRSNRAVRLQAMICALTTLSKPSRNTWAARILEGARIRAGELGFGFDQLNLAEYLNKPDRLQRVLRSRGVEGIIMLPMTEPIACEQLVNWDDFSVVSTSHSVVSPEFCRVVADQFNNLMLLCRELTLRGFRRIGLEMPLESEVRLRHNYTAAMMWHNTYGGTEAVKPLLVESPEDSKLVDWLQREQPDVVVTWEVDWFLDVMTRYGGTNLPKFQIANVSHHGSRTESGIDERGEEVGRIAVDLVTGMILRGEKGVPTVTKNMLIQGRWVEGMTVLKGLKKKVRPD